MGGKKKREPTENVRVVVRTRPMSESEQDGGCEEVMRIGADKASIQVLLPSDEDFTGASRQTVKKFALDGCLDQSTTQAQCFERSGMKTLLDSALEGFSATVFAYGQTGSGKTYTMTGPADPADMTRAGDPSDIDGVIPRSIRYIFDQVDARKDKTKYTIRASFLEIYNEQVRDLWNPSSGGLSIREYPPGYWRGFYVEDLYIFECTTVDDMLFMLAEGMGHRAVGSHNLNKDSSRSHSMLTFYLESEEDEAGDPYVKFGKISFVDLAGSERLKETQGGSAFPTQDFQATFRSRARMKVRAMKRSVAKTQMQCDVGLGSAAVA
jgi:kinesin family protein 12